MTTRRGFLRLLSGAATVLGTVGIPWAVIRPLKALFAPGSEADLTIRAGEDFALTGDGHFGTLTIEPGGRLRMNGHTIFVKRLVCGGTIHSRSWSVTGLKRGQA